MTPNNPGLTIQRIARIIESMNSTQQTEPKSLFAECACGATYFRPNGCGHDAPAPEILDLVGYLNEQNAR